MQKRQPRPPDNRLGGTPVTTWMTTRAGRWNRHLHQSFLFLGFSVSYSGRSEGDPAE